VIRKRPLPSDIDARLATLGDVLRGCPGLVFAYLFGGAAKGRLTPSSDVDVAAFFDGRCELLEARLEATRRVTRHLGTDEVDLVVLNIAPTSLLGRILGTRRVLCDGDPFLRHRFESKALREFFDFRIFEQRLLERKLGRG